MQSSMASLEWASTESIGLTHPEDGFLDEEDFLFVKYMKATLIPTQKLFKNRIGEKPLLIFFEIVTPLPFSLEK